MTHSEVSEGHHPSEQSPATSSPTEIGITPFPDEIIVFQEQPDGNHTMSFRGKVLIQGEITEGEITIAIRPPVTFKPSELPVTAQEEQSSGLLPESTSPPVTEPHNASDTASPPPSETKDSKAVEQGNELHKFTGNPTYDAKYWELKSGKRVAEFVLATHPEEGQTEYKRIRSFDGLAVYVRDNVRKGQKDVFVEAWGPKHWTSRNQKDITGYYGKRVKVPKKYLPKQSD
jgi:hypothetical protein